MMNQQRTPLLAALTLALVALTLGAACGKKADDAAITATAPTGKNAAATSSPAAGNAATSTAAAKGGDDFAALFAKYKAAESRVDYNLVTTGAGAMTGTMTMRQAAGSQRIDYAAPEGSVTFIAAPGKTLICIAEQKICLDAGAMGAGGPGGSPLVGMVQDLNTNGAAYASRPIDGRRIAGIDARCFELTSPKSEKSVTCVGPDGQMLLTEFSGAGTTTTMTATAVGAKPTAADFEAPYPVTSLSGLGGLGGLPTPPVRP
jgi:hypothetical protein